MSVVLLFLVPLAMTVACTSGRNVSPVLASSDSMHGDSRRTARGCETGDWLPPSVLEGVRLDPGMPCGLRLAVIGALEAAGATLERRKDCRAIFSALGTDGLEVLARSRYVVATARDEEKICKNAVAFTFVGGPWVGICRGFSRLDELNAATVILHEALHQAGLGEWPLDRRAESSLDITRNVRRRCGLDTGR
jgi:hypothetical protein